MTRKRRTREHVIEDLSFNHVERFVLFCGWSSLRQSPDYGIDLTIQTYDEHGEIENGCINIQLKGTDHLRTTAQGDEVICIVLASDLDYWLEEPFPVFLIRYDAVCDRAYWLHVQEHIRALPGFELSELGKTITVRIPITNMLSKEAIQEFARRKDMILRKFRE